MSILPTPSIQLARSLAIPVDDLSSMTPFELFQQQLESGSAEAAVSAAFEQWFASETRQELYYGSVCSDYLDRQDANKALPRYQLIPAEYFTVLCKLPDGESYQCSKPKLKSR